MRSIIEPEGQGTRVEEARMNLLEALELFFESAEPAEIRARMREG